MYATLKSCVNISSNCATSYCPCYIGTRQGGSPCYIGTRQGGSPCYIGTRQGDISSPTICSLFIDQLSDLLLQKCETFNKQLYCFRRMWSITFMYYLQV